MCRSIQAGQVIDQRWQPREEGGHKGKREAKKKKQLLSSVEPKQ